MKVLKAIVNIVLWIVLILALLVTIIVFSSGRNNGVANLFGFVPLTVESDSMKPTFKKGDLIICREIDDINSLQKDDVITFWTIIDGKKVKNTHRIVDINIAENTRSFVTRGDNNSIDDDMPAYAGDLIGKWTGVKIGGFGKVMAYLRTKTGFFICIVVPMAIFFLVELYKFIVVLIEIKKPKLSETDEEEIKRKAIEEYLAEKKKEEAESSEKAETSGKKEDETSEKKEDEPAEKKEDEPADGGAE